MLATVALAGAAHAVPLPAGPLTFHWTDYENLVTEPGQQLTGVFSLDTITVTGSPTAVWTQGQGGEYIYGTFQGLIAQSPFSNVALATDTFTGGTLDAYLFNSAQSLTNSATVFTNLATGSLWLSAAFAPGSDTDFPLATLVSTIFNNNGVDGKTGVAATLGTGSALLDVTGGSTAATLNTNSYLNPTTGLYDDISLANTFSILHSAPAGALGWAIVSSDPLNVTAVPEPGTFALLGIGLMGMALFGKRKMNK
jgi:hypothetical protein